MNCQLNSYSSFETRRREGSTVHRPILAVTANAMQGSLIPSLHLAINVRYGLCVHFPITSRIRPRNTGLSASKTLAPHRVILAGKGPVQVRCGADQRQMRECLGEVPEMLPAWTDLLRVEPKMVGISQEFLK